MSELATLPEDVKALIESRSTTPQWEQVNRIERMLAEREQVVCPLNHTFTAVPGSPELHLYARQIHMPAGLLLTSHIHLYEHPFNISQGTCSVWSNENGWETFVAPYSGVTKPATRRVLYIHKDTVWTTYHVTKASTPDAAVEEISMSPFGFGHMDGIAPDKLAAVRNNCRENKLIN